MKKLELNEMENLIAGTTCDNLKEEIAVIGLVAGIASMFGPIGLLIAGPTALGMGIITVYCAFEN